jgi:predicted amidophosphoribosyltransferase
MNTSFKEFGFDRPDRTPARIAKAQAFWQSLNERRKNPANCCRCGKPRDGKTRQCSKCLKYQAKYRGKLVDKDAKLTGSVVVAMVKQMRKEMDMMQARFKLWQKAVKYRAALKYRTNAMRKKYLPQVSPEQALDYLAETNHAYEQED